MKDGYNTTELWHRDLAHIFNMGSRVSPRSMGTREIVGFTSKIDMNFPVITCPIRALGYKFMFAEAAWILSGDNRVETITAYSKDIANFSDDGITFFGAYGPKIAEQMKYVIETLKADQETRQAVINIWRENPAKSKDIPCTLSAQFLIRNGFLHCVVNMRSSDLWLGHPYDIFNFSVISAWIVIMLRLQGVTHIQLGELTLNAGSKHLYSRNFEDVERVLEGSSGTSHQPGFNLDPSKFVDGREFAKFLWSVADSEKTVARLVACG